MAARIFISYRSADGTDKATALARDLGCAFGPEQVFLDKDDLQGGSAWRDEIARALGEQPVLLLLMTPQMFGATDAQGRPRVADPSDPVRREVDLALAAGAHLIPVLCDGLDSPPDATRLPQPFNRIGELTWRRLRAYDWSHDVERLVADLKGLGVAPAVPPPGAPPQRRLQTRRWLAGAALAVLLLGIAAWLLSHGTAPAGTAAGPFGGDWIATLADGTRLPVELRHEGDLVVLASAPLPIAQRADWAAYRRFWRERTGSDLDAVRYLAEGRVLRVPTEPPLLDLALRVLASPGDALIDGGNVQLRMAADANRLHGQVWLNSEQAQQPVTLQRGRR